MKVLRLTLKKKWFDMILSGEKKEEYREIKDYWVSRLCDSFQGSIGGDLQHKHKTIAYRLKQVDFIEFINGYSKNAPKMIVKCEGVEIKKGNAFWGAEEGKEYFVLKLGEVTDFKNILT